MTDSENREQYNLFIFFFNKPSRLYYIASNICWISEYFQNKAGLSYASWENCKCQNLGNSVTEERTFTGQRDKYLESKNREEFC